MIHIVPSPNLSRAYSRRNCLNKKEGATSLVKCNISVATFIYSTIRMEAVLDTASQGQYMVKAELSVIPTQPWGKGAMPSTLNSL